MTLVVDFTLAGPARGKGRHRTKLQQYKSGKVYPQAYPEPETVKYESQLRYEAKQAMGGRPPIAAGVPILCWIEAIYEIPESMGKRDRERALMGWLRPCKKPDFDNFGKLAADSLNGIVYADDRQIVDGRVIKRYARQGEGPGLHIRVATIDAPAPATVLRPAPTDDLFARAQVVDGRDTRKLAEATQP